MEVTSCLKELLTEYECVIIPDFGALLTRYTPSSVDTNSSLFSPPKKEVSFNSLLFKNDGILKIINTNLLEDSKKNQIVMGRNTQISLEDEKGMQIAIYKVPYGSKLFFKNGDKVSIIESKPFSKNKKFQVMENSK